MVSQFRMMGMKQKMNYSSTSVMLMRKEDDEHFAVKEESDDKTLRHDTDNQHVFLM